MNETAISTTALAIKNQRIETAAQEQFVQLEQIKMQREVCAHTTCTFIVNGGALPTYSLTR